MTYRFMQQHTRPARTEHDRHAAGWGVYRFQVHQRLAHRLAGIIQRPAHLTHRLEEILVTETTTTASAAAFTAAIALHQHGTVKTHQRTHIGTQGTVGPSHQHLFIDTGEGGDHLGHRRIQGTGITIYLLQQLNLLALVDRIERIHRLIEQGRVGRLPDLDLATATTLGYPAGRDHRLAQGQQADLVRIGKAGLLTANGPDTNPLIDVVATVFDYAVFQHPGFVVTALEIEIAKVHLMPHQLTQQAGQNRFVQFMGCQQAIGYLIQQHYSLSPQPWRNRACPITGMSARICSRSDRSSLAWIRSGLSAASASTTPQGSMITEWPQVWRLPP